MGIEQAIDQMEVAGPARSRAYRKPAGNLRLGGGSERCHLLMPDMDPVDGLSLAQRLGQAVQAVTDHAEDPLYAGLNQRFGDQVGDVIDWHDGLSFSRF